MNDRHLAALFLIGFYGVAGVLLDIDHLVAVVAKDLPVTLYNLSHHGSRAAHIPTVVVFGLVLCAAVTYLVGWAIAHRRN